MNQDKHHFVIYTDQKLDESESLYPFIDKVTDEWTMWLSKNNYKSNQNLRIELTEV